MKNFITIYIIKKTIMPDIPTFMYDKSFIYHINSRDRIDGTPSNFTYKVEVSNGRLDEYDSVVVLSASIPKSYYTFPTGRNTFTFTENSIDYTITITRGTYSATQLADYLSTELTNAGVNTYTATINLNSAKFIFESNISTIFSFTFGDYVASSLGFNPNTTYTRGPFNRILAPNVCDVSPENDVYIRSNIVSGGINSNEDILIDIQASGVAPFGRIQLYNIDLPGYTKGLNTSSNIYNFRITDEFNDELDLNGVDWTMSILFFKKSTIPQIIKDFIKYIVNKF